MEIVIPEQVQKYFWGDNLNELSWVKHRKYITETLLKKGDSESIRWLFKVDSKQNILKNLSSFNLDHKSRNFWEMYLS